MAKLETFQCKRTNWIGVWRDKSTGLYSSAVFKLSKLKEFDGPVRIYMCCNSYRKFQNENAPTHVLKIQGVANSDGEVSELGIYNGYSRDEVKDIVAKTIDTCREAWYWNKDGEDAVVVDDILPEDDEELV